MPYDQKIHNTQKIKPMKERYRDVNKNEIKVMGKTWVTVDYNRISTKLPMLITKRNDQDFWLITKRKGQRDRPIRKHIQKVPQALHHQPHKKTLKAKYS